jgi:RNA polymerase sigma factor (sigma-70 family)
MGITSGFVLVSSLRKRIRIPKRYARREYLYRHPVRLLREGVWLMMAQTEPNQKAEPDVPGGVHHQAALRRYCLSLTGSRWDAEDLAQDAWLKASGILTSTGHPNVEAYMLRIAKNTWIDQTRRNHALARLMMQELPKAAEMDQGWMEIEAVFQSLVRHLTPLQRSVFLLRDGFGLSNAETAERIGTTEGAVKAALRRSRLSLGGVRKELEDGSTAEPVDEALQGFIRALASAYQSGDVARLAELALQDVIPPVTAMAIAQSRLVRKPTAGARCSAYPTPKMAA